MLSDDVINARSLAERSNNSHQLAFWVTMVLFLVGTHHISVSKSSCADHLFSVYFKQSCIVVSLFSLCVVRHKWVVTVQTDTA